MGFYAMFDDYCLQAGFLTSLVITCSEAGIVCHWAAFPSEPWKVA